MAKQKIRAPSTPVKQTVSAGEVCSIDIAKKYGFYDKDHYYTDDYSDVKTYSDIDTDQGRDSNALCKQTNDGKIAYPSCSLVYGVPYEQDPTDRSKCVVNIRNFCPPKMTKGGMCKRSNIMLPAPVSMQTHCDEKITDWYMIPNYHLGNKYNFIQKKGNTEAQCMKPCPVDRVPGYVQDPVDNSSAGIRTNTELIKCYTKDEYMGGKYSETENFCPIAWVYRLGRKEEDIADDIIEKINDSGASNTYKKIAVSVANNEAKQVYKDSKRLLENIDFPNDATLGACSKLNTQERVEKAYSICKNIQTNPDSIDTLTSDPIQKQVLINSCHVLFCNEETDTSSMISSSAEPLCFDNFKPIDGEDLLLNDKRMDLDNNPNAAMDQPPKKIELSSLNNGPNILKVEGFVFMLILGLVIIGIFLYIFWDWIRPLLVYMMCSIIWIYDKIVFWVGKKEPAGNFEKCVNFFKPKPQPVSV